MKLGVNVDHVATVRQARLGVGPDPVEAALLAEKGGADSIVCHLREDRRHIQGGDLVRLKKALKGEWNLEMSAAPEIVRIALDLKPDKATIVPERRRELTTEGGLDVLSDSRRLASVVRRLRDRGVRASLFIEPDSRIVRAAAAIGAYGIELHTGRYAGLRGGAARKEVEKIRVHASLGCALGLFVAAGHGLDYRNVSGVAAIPEIQELNIGHSIVGRAIMVGMATAVGEMKRLVR